jgi:hypothetical protein
MVFAEDAVDDCGSRAGSGGDGVDDRRHRRAEVTRGEQPGHHRRKHRIHHDGIDRD